MREVIIYYSLFYFLSMSVQGIPDGLLLLEHTKLDFFHDSDSVVNVFLPPPSISFFM